MKFNTELTHQVVDGNGISIKFFASKEEAEEVAKEMTKYHGKKFNVEKIEW